MNRIYPPIKGREGEKNSSKIDPYFNPVADKFKEEYKKILKKSDCYLDNLKLKKLIEIYVDYPEFLNLLPEILTKYSKLNFTNGKPSLRWLIVEGGWAGILNGEYDRYMSDENSETNNFFPVDYTLGKTETYKGETGWTL